MSASLFLDLFADIIFCMIKVIQVGMGPVAFRVTRYLMERPALKLVGAVDIDPKIVGKDVGEVAGLSHLGIDISSDLEGVLKTSRADVAIVTTASTLAGTFNTLQTILSAGVSVVSSCEELAFAPPEMSEPVRLLDKIAKEHGVTLLGTGINPGFLMDYFPLVVSCLHQRVDSLFVERVQDASTRRLPFQKKIGYGASEEEFKRRVKNKTLRHVGLTESLQFLLHYLGLRYSSLEETIEPVRDGRKITGVKQVATAVDESGKEVGKLLFKASVGEKEPRDRVVLKGEPDTEVLIPGAMHGDIGTCAILINAVPAVLRAEPGYRTMAEIFPPHWRL